MKSIARRQFLADVGRGMLVAGVGSTLAMDLGLSRAWAEESSRPLTFGALDPLVDLMQQTPADKLMPLLVEKVQQGTPLRTLVAAGSLANAKTFGGQDYIGFHSFMALNPALKMSEELPSEKASLPVLKVLYRNTNRMQAFGGKGAEVLHEVEAAELPAGADGDKLMQEASRAGDVNAAERTFAALAKGPAGEAYNHLQFAVQDEVDVHRVVLAWRAWAALDITGPEYAHTMLRQSVRYCTNTEQQMKSRNYPTCGIRTLLPKLLDQYKLVSLEPGTRKAEDAWIEKLSHQVANASRDEAADAVAAALAEGIAPEDVGQALALAANELVLRDPGRPKEWASEEKPEGSVHGDSVGVHASDACNAWRHIARASNRRNAVASLIVCAYHTAGQNMRLNKEFYPLPDQVEAVKALATSALLKELEDAVRGKDQFRAAAIVQAYSDRMRQSDNWSRPIFDVLLRYGISEDGALHAEKYYRTVSEEFATLRPAFRHRQLVALARVTASEYGRPAPGYKQACELLKV